MSVGQDFDRSILERKDLAALLAIAQSLGAKPSSRAKKADIVDVILAAAGHIGDDSSTEPDAAAEPATAATDTRAEAEQPALVAAGHQADRAERSLQLVRDVGGEVAAGGLHPQVGRVVVAVDEREAGRAVLDQDRAQRRERQRRWREGREAQAGRRR